MIHLSIYLNNSSLTVHIDDLKIAINNPNSKIVSNGNKPINMFPIISYSNSIVQTSQHMNAPIAIEPYLNTLTRTRIHNNTQSRQHMKKTNNTT